MALNNVSNKNVELGGKNGFKLFHKGIAHWIRKAISVDGGFHISMSRQLVVFLCTMDRLPMELKKKKKVLLIVIQSPRASTYARAEVTNQCISRHNQHVISVNEIHMQTFLQKKMQLHEVALSISLGGYTEGHRVSST